MPRPLRRVGVGGAMECGNQYGAGEEWLTGGQRRSEAKNGRGYGWQRS